MDNDKKNFCTMYPPLTHRNYIDTDIVSNKERFYMGGFTKPLKERKNMEIDKILVDDKLDTFKAFHWLDYLLDGGKLDEDRLKYLRTFTQVICDILSDHEIYTTNDLRDAMKELECIQALDEVRNDLHDLEYNLNDIQLKIERSRSKWKK